MNPPRVVIIASGGANIASLTFALERLGVDSAVSAEPERIMAASHVILPGVGAAADAMARLRATGIDRLIPTLRQPVLGICLGMQLLFDSSEEGDTACLGVIPGRVTRLHAAPGRPVPHIGWNTLEIRTGSPLLAGIRGGDYAYFVHGYAADLGPCTSASTAYGAAFSACVQRGNFHGAQFHPERSAAAGARLLRNFVALRCD
ncbi:MAG: imidazole glycerol phosphate synthase subunit HisH [Gammaproteobacteria bacterium]|nr:imidazole glycerol phosphate synthase subunit HisH [Gammaproteobacteria bacterium]